MVSSNLPVANGQAGFTCAHEHMQLSVPDAVLCHMHVRQAVHQKYLSSATGIMSRHAWRMAYPPPASAPPPAALAPAAWKACMVKHWWQYCMSVVHDTACHTSQSRTVAQTVQQWWAMTSIYDINLMCMSVSRCILLGVCMLL